MTEAEWLAATEPGPMLNCIARRRRRLPGAEQKLALFACACCRRIWRLIPNDACRAAVEVAERYADGSATDRERHAAWSAASVACDDEGYYPNDGWYSELIEWGCVPGGMAIHATLGLVGAGKGVAHYVAGLAAEERARDAGRVWGITTVGCDETRAAEAADQSAFLRDILGNPYRPAPTVDPSWLAWRDGVVRVLARAAYEHRRLPVGTLEPERLAALADALEGAGCGDAELLGHLRGPGPHVRGCWAVDLLLGRE